MSYDISIIHIYNNLVWLGADGNPIDGGSEPAPNPEPSTEGKVFYKTSADGEWLESAANISNGTFNGFNEKSSAVAVILPSKDASGNNVTSIDYNAFGEDRVLTSVTIPSSVSSVGESAFEFCENLATITVLGKTTQQAQALLNDAYAPQDCTIVGELG